MELVWIPYNLSTSPYISKWNGEWSREEIAYGFGFLELRNLLIARERISKYCCESISLHSFELGISCPNRTARVAYWLTLGFRSASFSCSDFSFLALDGTAAAFSAFSAFLRSFSRCLIRLFTAGVLGCFPKSISEYQPTFALGNFLSGDRIIVQIICSLSGGLLVCHGVNW